MQALKTLLGQLAPLPAGLTPEFLHDALEWAQALGCEGRDVAAQLQRELGAKYPAAWVEWLFEQTGWWTSQGLVRPTTDYARTGQSITYSKIRPLVRSLYFLSSLIQIYFDKNHQNGQERITVYNAQDIIFRLLEKQISETANGVAWQPDAQAINELIRLISSPDFPDLSEYAPDSIARAERRYGIKYEDILTTLRTWHMDDPDESQLTLFSSSEPTLILVHACSLPAVEADLGEACPELASQMVESWNTAEAGHRFLVGSSVEALKTWDDCPWLIAATEQAEEEGAFVEESADGAEFERVVRELLERATFPTQPGPIRIIGINYPDNVSRLAELLQDEGYDVIEDASVTIETDHTGRTASILIHDFLELVANRENRLQYLRNDPVNNTPKTSYMQPAIDWLEHITTERNDKTLPWIAREIRKGRIKGSIREDGTWRPDVNYAPNYATYANGRPVPWTQFFGHLEDWLTAKRPSIMGMVYDDVAANLHEWDIELSEDKGDEYEEKNVVYEFDDGWTIQKVRTSNDLQVEGNKMGHCVGSYCNAVSRGDSYIFSLRDPRNEPHVTVESNEEPPTKFVQVQGKGNEAPIPEYAGRVLEWAHDVMKRDFYNVVMNGDGAALFERELTRYVFGSDYSHGQFYNDLEEMIRETRYGREHGGESGFDRRYGVTDDESGIYLMPEGREDVVEDLITTKVPTQYQEELENLLRESTVYSDFVGDWKSAEERVEASPGLIEKIVEKRYMTKSQERTDALNGFKAWYGGNYELDTDYIKRVWGNTREFFTHLAIQYGIATDETQNDSDLYEEASEAGYEVINDMYSNLMKIRKDMSDRFDTAALQLFEEHLRRNGKEVPEEWRADYPFRQLTLPGIASRRRDLAVDWNEWKILSTVVPSLDPDPGPPGLFMVRIADPDRVATALRRISPDLSRRVSGV